jgi:glyoxylase-like metal-dependent hydrolase (beta-lactamase superfamily II)
MNEQGFSYISKHFSIHSLTDDVCAAIATGGGSAICNAGLLNLGGLVVVFDTFLTPQAAMDLRQVSLEKFGTPPQIVINSHYHNDHIWGNQVFSPDAKIISSTRTRELITTAGKEEFDWYAANSAQQMESFRTQYQSTSDTGQKKQLYMWIGYYAGLVEAIPYLTVCLPVITFDVSLEIHGAKHCCNLMTFEGAHSGSDTVLFFPEDRITFMGDLLFVGCHPYLADGNPKKLLQALRELGQLNADRFVPGHGPVGTNDDVRQLIEYIEQCYETANNLIKTGDDCEDKVRDLKISKRFQHWYQPQFYQSNIRFLCKQMKSENQDHQVT